MVPAMKWCLLHDPERALQLTAALARYWRLVETHHDERHWLDEAREHGDFITSKARAHALLQSVLFDILENKGGELQTTRCEDARKIYLKHNDSDGEAEALRHLGMCFSLQGDWEAALSKYDEALEKFSKNNNVGGQAMTLLSKSQLSRLRTQSTRDHEQTAQWCFESLIHFRDQQNTWGIRAALEDLEKRLNDIEGLSPEKVSLQRALLSQLIIQIPLESGWDQRHLRCKVLHLASLLGDRKTFCEQLYHLAKGSHRMPMAHYVQLFGAVLRLNDELPEPILTSEEILRYRNKIFDQDLDPDFDTCLKLGQAMTIEEIIKKAEMEP
jgi:tetratricopeptide (TPR) repeat protein